MDEQLKALDECCDESWWFYQASRRVAQAMRDTNSSEKVIQERINKLNSKTANILLNIEALVDSGVLSHESIESTMIKKVEEREKGEN